MNLNIDWEVERETFLGLQKLQCKIFLLQAGQLKAETFVSEVLNKF